MNEYSTDVKDHPDVRDAVFHSRYGSGQSEGGGRERRHSHTVTSMTDSDSPPQLPSPTHVTRPYSAKTTNVGKCVDLRTLVCVDLRNLFEVFIGFKKRDFLHSGSYHESQLWISDHTLKQHPGQ